MADTLVTVGPLPTRIDRYPAKMISRLASTLVERYALNATHLLDPFCGSGAVLSAGVARGLRVTGIDLNPFAVLLSKVKVQGFDAELANARCEELLSLAATGKALFPMEWDNKAYWFTPATVRKYEEIRHAARELRLTNSSAGRAVLLAVALSVRPCSRADQRSPKPFISKYARRDRVRRHFDPHRHIRELLSELAALYGRSRRSLADVRQEDIASARGCRGLSLRYSHVITSPPYINAQDYFRNFKLELYVLERILPFRVSDIIHRFIGTERHIEGAVVDSRGAEERRRLVPSLRVLERDSKEQAAIFHRYLQDMAVAFERITQLMAPSGTLVIVCGDNLIGGQHICTWQVLSVMLEKLGFVQFDRFGDRIKNRAVAPTRCGHKGLIKEEIVSAFRLGASPTAAAPERKLGDS